MIEIKVSLDMIDYSSLLPIITKTVTKNKILSKAIKLTVDGKLSKMTEKEKNTYLVSFIEEHKERITEILNEYAKNKNIIGYITDISAKFR